MPRLSYSAAIELTMPQIWTLPKLSLVFSTSIIKDLPSVLSDSSDPPALSLPEDPPRKPQDTDVDLLQVAQIGESCPNPHLIVSPGSTDRQRRR